MWKPTICRAFSGRDTVPHLLRVPSQIIWATAKFRFMESSIRAFSIFWKLSWGLENDIYHQIAHIFLPMDLAVPSSTICWVWGKSDKILPQCLDPKGYVFYTSSTAQGGGGSFKDRKPIGEIGCCESGMAKRTHWWTERCLRSPLFLSLSLTIYLPTNLSSMYLSIYRSIYLSLFLSFI